ncbi:MAG: hypothetical protein KJO79_00130 [Verrucomicrobiae bacterium]|nr:hypothetical protein [Verrucomicrobiae bacterium]NNJ85552.1 hypothetical protein [Akkermansiaceae bacterium]
MGHFITSKDIPADGEHLKKGALSKWIGISGLVAALGIIVSAWLLFSNNEATNTPSDAAAGRYAYSWLFAFAFFVSFSLGGCFWLLLHHVSNSGWGVSVRRLMENLASVFPWMGLLAIPFLFPQVQQHLFEWMNEHRGLGAGLYGGAKEALHTSHESPFHHMLYKKYFYMNLPFWLFRMIGYFVLLGGSIYILKKLSVDQDNDPKPGVERLKKARKLCAAILPIFALTVTFLAFDLLKALDYKWFSTMYGVYFFAGCALNGMALLILTSILLRRAGYLQTVMSPEHHHIMGKLTFAFVVFWAYVTFSQFFLIWYANITEETSYFLLRNTGNWNLANIALVFGHFALPFLFLIRQDVKKKPGLMIPITLYLFVLHALDHYLIVAPERGPSLTIGAENGPSLFPSGSVVWYDLLAFVTVGACFIFIYLRTFTKNSLYPSRDPRILESANLYN